METEVTALAWLARVLGHETCVRLLDSLTQGEATVTELTTRLDLEQPRVSSHLALLREAGLVKASEQGRQRVYRLASASVPLSLSTLRTLAANLRPGALSAEVPGLEDAPIRQARTCYDHLAGRAGVLLLDQLLERGWLEARAERSFELSAEGEAALTGQGINVSAARRARRGFAVGCQDWTERRLHLGGALGAALLARLVETDRAKLIAGSRVVRLSQPEVALWPA